MDYAERWDGKQDVREYIKQCKNKGLYANLHYANLRGADLSYADLSYADLSYADLSYANLRGADLRYANLRGANLSSADLRGANLSNADLRDADLSYADLRGANLRGATLPYPINTSFNGTIAAEKFDKEHEFYAGCWSGNASEYIKKIREFPLPQQLSLLHSVMAWSAIDEFWDEYKLLNARCSEIAKEIIGDGNGS